MKLRSIICIIMKYIPVNFQFIWSCLVLRFVISILLDFSKISSAFQMLGLKSCYYSNQMFISKSPISSQLTSFETLTPKELVLCCMSSKGHLSLRENVQQQTVPLFTESPSGFIPRILINQFNGSMIYRVYKPKHHLCHLKQFSFDFSYTYQIVYNFTTSSVYAITEQYFHEKF